METLEQFFKFFRFEEQTREDHKEKSLDKWDGTAMKLTCFDLDLLMLYFMCTDYVFSKVRINIPTKVDM